jgi:hypothetical protein
MQTTCPTFGTCQLRALNWVHANYVRYIEYMPTTYATLGTCQLRALHWVHANYMRYIGYTSTTCATLDTCQLHALHLVHANYVSYIGYLQITCSWYFSLFITMSSFFCYFNSLNPTGKHKNRPNIMKISVLSRSVHLFFVQF